MISYVGHKWTVQWIKGKYCRSQKLRWKTSAYLCCNHCWKNVTIHWEHYFNIKLDCVLISNTFYIFYDRRYKYLEKNLKECIRFLRFLQYSFKSKTLWETKWRRKSKFKFITLGQSELQNAMTLSPKFSSSL